MVVTHRLLQERAEALERLRDTLAGLDGADAERVHETAARAGQGHVGASYEVALFVSEIADVLSQQQGRISELESRVSEVSTPKDKRKR